MYNTFGVLQGAACFPAVNGQLNTSPTALFGGEYYPGLAHEFVWSFYCQTGALPQCRAQLPGCRIRSEQGVLQQLAIAIQFPRGRHLGQLRRGVPQRQRSERPGHSSSFDLTSAELGLLGQQLGNGPSIRIESAERGAELHRPNGLRQEPRAGCGCQYRIRCSSPRWPHSKSTAIRVRCPSMAAAIWASLLNRHCECTHGISLEVLGEKQLKFEFDAFNIADTKRSILSEQEVDLSFGQPNADFANHIPLTFVAPFSARFAVIFRSSRVSRYGQPHRNLRAGSRGVLSQPVFPSFGYPSKLKIKPYADSVCLGWPQNQQPMARI